MPEFNQGDLGFIAEPRHLMPQSLGVFGAPLDEVVWGAVAPNHQGLAIASHVPRGSNSEHGGRSDR